MSTFTLSSSKEHTFSALEKKHNFSENQSSSEMWKLFLIWQYLILLQKIVEILNTAPNTNRHKGPALPTEDAEQAGIFRLQVIAIT